MPTSENHADEVHRLRNAMRDLVALSTLPAVWAGYSPKGVAHSLAEVLLNTLALDLIYIRAHDNHAAGEIEVVRGKGVAIDPGQARGCRGTGSLAYPQRGRTAGVHSPSAGQRGVARCRRPFRTHRQRRDRGGLLRRQDFPNETDRLLLSVGTNQMAIVLQRKRAEQSLAEERERLGITLASIGDAVIATDTEGRVTFLNGVAESLTGWPRPRPPAGRCRRSSAL